MSLLSELLMVLNESELKLLRDLPLPSKEQELLRLHLSQKGSEPRKSDLLEKLSTTDANLRKMQTVLLQKIYRQLVPGAGIALLGYLGDKRVLNVHLEHELRRQEEAVAKKDLLYFYSAAFLELTGTPRGYENDALIRIISKKMVAATAVTQRLTTELEVEAILIMSQFKALGGQALLFKEPHKSQMLSDMTHFLAKAVKSQSPLALFHAHWLLFEYYKFFSMPQQQQHIEEAAQKMEKLVSN